MSNEANNTQNETRTEVNTEKKSLVSPFWAWMTVAAVTGATITLAVVKFMNAGEGLTED